MFAHAIVWEDGDEDRHEAVASDVHEQITELIHRLDGRARTLVMLYGECEAQFAVGGSASEGVVAYATFDNQTFHQMTDPDAPDGEITVVAGRQQGNYPRRYIVAAANAVAAATLFAGLGALDIDSTWEVP